MLFDDDTFKQGGKTFKVEFPRDEFHGAPWKEEDGHGPVSDWRRKPGWRDDPPKSPGEMILCRDRSDYLTYDFCEAVKIARRDDWGFPGMTEEDRKTMRPGQIAHRAALADFDHLRRWCNEAWCYVGVVVTLLGEDGEDTDETESLWGVESDSEDYLETVAHELAGEILARVRKEENESLEIAARQMEESRPGLYGSA